MTHRIVFMGSPDFAIPSLEALLNRFEVVGVVTQPDRKAGRGRNLTSPPVKEIADLHRIPVIQPARVRESDPMDQLRTWAPDLIVVAAFGQILKQDLLDLPAFGSINVHASLLPRWRGASPVAQSIYHGDSRTGVTIMKMDAGLDTGPILSQSTIGIRDEDTGLSLSARLSHLGADLLLETLPGYLSGVISSKKQPEDGSTYAPLLKKEAGTLDFSRTAVELERQVRAYQPWPGSFMAMETGPLKIQAAGSILSDLNVGERAVMDGFPVVGTRDGALVLKQVQPVGKKPMSGEDYLRGARDWIVTDESEASA